MTLLHRHKWRKAGNFWYRTTFMGHKIDLRWYGSTGKRPIAFNIDGGEWIQWTGKRKLWEAKVQVLDWVERNNDMLVREVDECEMGS